MAWPTPPRGDLLHDTGVAPRRIRQSGEPAADARDGRWRGRHRPAPRRSVGIVPGGPAVDGRAHRSPGRSTPVVGRASSSISTASASVTVQRSGGPPPRNVSRHSRTSSALPQASPSGRSIAVISVTTGTPAACAKRDHRPGQFEAALELRQEGTASRLHVEHEPGEALRQLLAHDAGGDQLDALHRGGGITQRVQATIRRCDLRGLSDQRTTDRVQLRCRLRQRQVRPEAGDALELVERSAGVAESASRHHRHGHTHGGERAAPAPATSCRPHRRWSACRSTAGHRPAAAACCRYRASPTSARWSRRASSPRKKIAISSAASW